ncbi:MAG: hypothetical protein QXP28_00665 [Archaeoglobaceae archaeon]
MERLKRASGEKWRKIVVGSGNRGKFEKYVKKFNSWLGDVEMCFVDESGEVERQGIGLRFSRKKKKLKILIFP